MTINKSYQSPSKDDNRANKSASSGHDQNRRHTSGNQGFASMNPDKQREIASKGGKAAHAKGTAHEWDSEEAREAGSKGGKAAHAKGTAHEWDSKEAREAGRKGGLHSHSSSNKSPNS